VQAGRPAATAQSPGKSQIKAERELRAMVVYFRSHRQLLIVWLGKLLWRLVAQVNFVIFT
jgi:hypothetical protein